MKASIYTFRLQIGFPNQIFTQIYISTTLRFELLCACDCGNLNLKNKGKKEYDAFIFCSLYLLNQN